MTTAQDQPSRELLPCPFCGGAPEQLRTSTYGNHGSDPQDVFTIQCCVSMRVSDYPGYLTDAVIGALKDKWNRGAPAVQAARALPAGMEPFGYWHQGPTDDESDFHLHADQGDVSCKKCITLYTAAQVQAMGRVPPEWQAVPVERTEEMKRAVMELLLDGLDIYVNGQEQIVIETDAPRRLWKAFLAAAPRPPAAQEGA